MQVGENKFPTWLVALVVGIIIGFILGVVLV